MLLLPSKDTGSQQAASQTLWDQHPVPCLCRELCSSSRAELSLPSPILRMLVSRGGTQIEEAAQASRKGEGKAGTLPGSEALIATEQRSSGRREVALLQEVPQTRSGSVGEALLSFPSQGVSWRARCSPVPLGPPGLGSLGSHLPQGVYHLTTAPAAGPGFGHQPYLGMQSHFLQKTAFPPEKETVQSRQESCVTVLLLSVTGSQT